MARPRKYDTVEELELAIEDYFEPLIKKTTYAGDVNISERIPIDKPTITGLALHLGFESRQSLYDYEKDGAFSYTIKNARLRIESKYEERLHEQACTGAIFALKNFGWKDKYETGFTDNQGRDVIPQIILQPAPNCEPLKND